MRHNDCAHYRSRSFNVLMPGLSAEAEYEVKTVITSGFDVLTFRCFDVLLVSPASDGRPGLDQERIVDRQDGAHIVESS